METIKIVRFNILDIPNNYYSVTLEKEYFPTDKSKLVYFDIGDTNHLNILGEGKGDLLKFSLPEGTSFVPEKNDYSVIINKMSEKLVPIQVNATTTLEVPISEEQQKSIMDYCVKDAPVRVSMGQSTPYMVPSFGFGNDSSSYLSLCYKENFKEDYYNEVETMSNQVASSFIDLASMDSNCYGDNTCVKEEYCAGCKTTIEPTLFVVVLYFATLLYILFRYK
jgi:hypothetical protein